MTVRYKYINSLSDFWLLFYKDAQIMEAALSAQAEMIKSHYFTFLQRELPSAVSTFPIFREHFWNLIEIFAEEAEVVDIDGNPTDVEELKTYIAYPLDEPYAKIPYLFNVIYEPTIIFKEGTKIETTEGVSSGNLEIDEEYINLTDENVINGSQIIPPNISFFAEDTTYTQTGTGDVLANKDYRIIRQTEGEQGESGLIIQSKILFRLDKDPFLMSDIAKRKDQAGRTSIVLYAPKVFLDIQELYKYYGAVLGILEQSSIEYRNLLNGLLNLYYQGPTTAILNASLNLASGYPVARQAEILTKISVSREEFTITSDQGNVYSIPRKEVKYYVAPPNIPSGQLVVGQQYQNSYDVSLTNGPNTIAPFTTFTAAHSEYTLIENPPDIPTGKVTIFPAVLQEVNKALPELKFEGREVITQDGLVFNNPTGLSTPLTTTPEVTWQFGEFTIYWEMKHVFDTFLNDLRIVDYKTEPKWWLEGVQPTLLQGLVDLPQEVGSNQNVIDYLFEKYLKYNTFGVFINPDVLTEFSVLKDFFGIIKRTKPTWKTFIVSEQTLSAFSEVLAEDVDATQVAMEAFIPIISVAGEKLKIGMDIYKTYFDNESEKQLHRIRLGMALEKIGSAMDIVRTTLELKSDLDENNIPIEGSIVTTYNMSNTVGTMLDGVTKLGMQQGIIEDVRLNLGITQIESEATVIGSFEAEDDNTMTADMQIDSEATVLGSFEVDDSTEVNLIDIRGEDALAFYIFLQNQGNEAFDYSDNEHTATLSNYLWIPSYLAGEYGIRFDGSSTDMLIPHEADLDITGDISIGWVSKFNDLTTDRTIIRKYDNAQLANSSYYVSILNNKLRIYLYDSNGTNVLVMESQDPLYQLSGNFYTEIVWDSTAKTLRVWVNTIEKTMIVDTGQPSYHPSMASMGAIRVGGTIPVNIGSPDTVAAGYASMDLFEFMIKDAVKSVSEITTYYGTLGI